MNGLALGVFGVGAAEHIRGIGLAPIGLGAGNELEGIMIGEVGAGSGGGLTGLAIGGIGVGSGGSISGITLGSADIRGIVVAPGFMRIEDDGRFRGVAAAGFNYMKGQQRGLTIGVVNYTRRLHGIQLGVINYARNNPPAFASCH
ncbi:MAG: hypothetical protein M3303_10885 [Gemmatimonadota bacterium]|nr:hypothetical protein [Gemmatimonadota bacterium]